jgi:hypothetical protein
MPNPTIEMATIRLRADRTEADLIVASDAFHRDFLNAQPGFLRRELLRGADGAYLDLAHWRSVDDANAMMEKAADSPACDAYFAVMEIDAADRAAGVSLYTQLAAFD